MIKEFKSNPLNYWDIFFLGNRNVYKLLDMKYFFLATIWQLIKHLLNAYKELYRLDYAKRVIEILNELKEHRHVHWNVMTQAFNGVIKLNGVSQYIVNPSFVKY